jgi:hypothetical protein
MRLQQLQQDTELSPGAAVTTLANEQVHSSRKVSGSGQVAHFLHLQPSDSAARSLAGDPQLRVALLMPDGSLRQDWDWGEEAAAGRRGGLPAAMLLGECDVAVTGKGWDR